MESLQERVEVLTNPELKIPNGFQANHRWFPGFFIPFNEEMYVPAKYIKCLPDTPTKVLGIASFCSNKPIYAMDLYATPIIEIGEATKPLPLWLMCLLTSMSPDFQGLLDKVQTLDDWGLAAEVQLSPSLEGPWGLRGVACILHSGQVQALPPAAEGLEVSSSRPARMAN
jgi:hypothetical protein